MKYKKLIVLLSSSVLASCGTNSTSTSVTTNTSTTGSTPTSEVPTTTTSGTTSTTQSIPSTTSELPKKDKEYTINSLRDSIYKEDIACDENLGLTNVSYVGIDKERFENEVLYKAPETFDHTYIASEHNIVPNDTNASYYLNILIAKLKTVSGTKGIIFEEGTYGMTSTIQIDGVNDLYFVGNNTRFVLNKWTTYINATYCNNLHFNNLEFDMNPSPTISGVVKSYDGTTNDGDHLVTVKIDDEFDLGASSYSSFDPKSSDNYQCSYMECRYDYATQRYVPDTEKNLIYNTASSNKTYRGIKDMKLDIFTREIQFTISKSFPWFSNHAHAFVIPAVDTHISFAFTMYNSYGFSFQTCNDTYFEHFACRTCGGMGLRVQNGKNMYMNKFEFAPSSNSKRIMTATADIIHTISLENELVITNSQLEASHDDAMNIKTYYGRVSSVNKSAREIYITQTSSEVTTYFDEGDALDFYDYANMELKAHYIVQSVAKKGANFTITVDKRPNDIVEGLVVANDTKATKLTLENSLIQNKRNRGILLQGRYCNIINCAFRNVVMGPIQALGVADSFGEAVVPTHVNIKNCKMLNNQGTDLGVFTYGSEGKTVPNTITNFDVSNNFFYGSRSLPMRYLGCGDCLFEHNLFSFEAKSQSVICTIEQCENCTFSNNVLNIDNNDIDNITFFRIDSGCNNIKTDNNQIYGGF